MGNYISCTLSSPSSKHSRPTKVILPTDEIQQFEGPINAAELMLETPNHFLVNSCSLQIGRRFSALSADEELEMGDVYVMFPMRRVNSVITAVDMGRLLITANSAVKRATRITPDSGGDANFRPGTDDKWREIEVPRLNLEDVGDGSFEFKHRLSMCKSRKPLLETITEEITQ